jgi:imidazole glycerol phosphate synthase subunit HisF
VGCGGVSGGPAWAAAYEYYRGLRLKLGVFLIMGCGVSSRAQVQRYFDIGADAFSICNLAVHDPMEAEKTIRSFAE